MDKVNMNKAPKVEVPTHLSLTAKLSAGLTIVLSTIYGISCLLLIASNTACLSFGEDSSTDSLFSIIHRLYVLGDECEDSLTITNITTSHSVLVLTSITLVACALCLIAAFLLISVVTVEKHMGYITVYASVYLCCCAASFVVDLTFGIHFGMDYGTFNGLLEDASGDDEIFNRMAQMGAMLLMVLTLKGFLVHLINITLLILLIVFVLNFQNELQTNEHSIHSVGVLNAYEHKKRNQTEIWHAQNDNIMSRGAEVNPSFISDDDVRSRTPTHRREPPMPDYSRSFERSESWHTPSAAGARPFSYLEEPRRPIPVKPPTSPAEEPHWRREEPQWRREDPQWRKEWAPAVPAPDYSPTSPRRLKSALKPSYM